MAAKQFFILLTSPSLPKAVEMTPASVHPTKSTLVSFPQPHSQLTYGIYDQHICIHVCHMTGDMNKQPLKKKGLYHLNLSKSPKSETDRYPLNNQSCLADPNKYKQCL